jgi:hypothetical protein
MLVIVAPGGLHERYFEQGWERLDDLHNPPPPRDPDLARLRAAMEAAGLEMVTPNAAQAHPAQAPAAGGSFTLRRKETRVHDHLQLSRLRPGHRRWSTHLVPGHGTFPCNPGTLGFLTGLYVPIDARTLSKLYPTHDAYVAKVTASANQVMADGFMLQEDAPTRIDDADASSMGKLGATITP